MHNSQIPNLFAQIKKTTTQEEFLELVRNNNIELPECVNDCNGNRETLLMLACKNLNLNLIKLFMEQGADPSIMDQNKNTALHHIFMNEDTSKVPEQIDARETRALIKMIACDENLHCAFLAKNSSECTPLKLAIQSNNIQAVKELIDRANKELIQKGGLTVTKLRQQLSTNAVTEKNTYVEKILKTLESKVGTQDTSFTTPVGTSLTKLYFLYIQTTAYLKDVLQTYYPSTVLCISVLGYAGLAALNTLQPQQSFIPSISYHAQVALLVSSFVLYLAERLHQGGKYKQQKAYFHFMTGLAHIATLATFPAATIPLALSSALLIITSSAAKYAYKAVSSTIWEMYTKIKNTSTWHVRYDALASPKNQVTKSLTTNISPLNFLSRLCEKLYPETDKAIKQNNL